jgi:hypothetical protein
LIHMLGEHRRTCKFQHQNKDLGLHCYRNQDNLVLCIRMSMMQCSRIFQLSTVHQLVQSRGIRNRGYRSRSHHCTIKGYIYTHLQQCQSTNYRGILLQ